MLCLRDPADPTNDLGRKGTAIKHVQATCGALLKTLQNDLRMNTRASLLGPHVGSSYMFYQDRRHKLEHYGRLLNNQMNDQLAIKAKAIRDAENATPDQAADVAQSDTDTTAHSTTSRSQDEIEQDRLARASNHEDWQRLAERRAEQLRLTAEKDVAISSPSGEAIIANTENTAAEGEWSEILEAPVDGKQ